MSTGNEAIDSALVELNYRPRRSSGHPGDDSHRVFRARGSHRATDKGRGVIEILHLGSSTPHRRGSIEAEKPGKSVQIGWKLPAYLQCARPVVYRGVGLTRL